MQEYIVIEVVFLIRRRRFAENVLFNVFSFASQMYSAFAIDFWLVVFRQKYYILRNNFNQLLIRTKRLRSKNLILPWTDCRESHYRKVTRHSYITAVEIKKPKSFFKLKRYFPRSLISWTAQLRPLPCSVLQSFQNRNKYYTNKKEFHKSHIWKQACGYVHRIQCQNITILRKEENNSRCKIKGSFKWRQYICKFCFISSFTEMSELN